MVLVVKTQEMWRQKWWKYLFQKHVVMMWKVIVAINYEVLHIIRVQLLLFVRRLWIDLGRQGLLSKEEKRKPYPPAPRRPLASHISSAAAVPVLCSVVKRIVKSSGGAVTSAKLSALWCDKCEILPHCGPTTEHLRIMVPLVVPTGATFDILVGNISPPQKLTLGQPLIFDDSIEHTVRYATPTTSLTTGKLPSPRIVLLLDVEHPDHGGNS